MNAELNARRTAAVAVLADFKHALQSAPLSKPPGREWMFRLADVLDDLLDALDQAGTRAPAPTGTGQPAQGGEDVLAADASQARHFTEFVRSAGYALLTRDITRRARWARDHNDGRPEPAWSTGERLAVALILDDQATLDADGYTQQEAAQRLAGDLAFYGYPGDVGTWLMEIRAALGRSRSARDQGPGR